MNYLKVRWIHTSSDDPVLLLSELDHQRYEVRKVDVYADGRMTYASEFISTGDTMLGEVPTPSVSEIGSDPEFEVLPINADEFESVWTEALTRAASEA